MGLILTFKEGEDLYFIVDDVSYRYIVEKVFSDRHYLLRDVKSNDLFEIEDGRSTEIFPDVRVSAAVTTWQANLNIEAPRDIKIVRGSLYRKGKKK